VRYFDRASVFIAYARQGENAPHYSQFLHYLFRQVNSPPPVFTTDGYTFEFVAQLYTDSYVYRVKRKQFSLQITFHAVDTAVYCGLDSSLYLLHFIWTNYYDRFSFVKHAICVAFLHPYTQPTTVTALYLQHYRAQSEGLQVALGYILCTRTARRLLRPVAACSRTHAQCFCTVCPCKPPSLQPGI
jgi:hypothetical protein